MTQLININQFKKGGKNLFYVLFNSNNNLVSLAYTKEKLNYIFSISVSVSNFILN